MINLKRWMAKVSERLKFSVADYSVTTGDTQYAGYYYADIITANDPAAVYVFSSTSNRPAQVIRVGANKLRVYAGTSGTNVTLRCLYLPNVGG